LSDTQRLYHTWNLEHIHAVAWNKEVYPHNRNGLLNFPVTEVLAKAAMPRGTMKWKTAFSYIESSAGQEFWGKRDDQDATYW
jgi:hypothetical protein